MRRFIIENVGGEPETPPAAAEEGRRLDLQDCLLIGGLAFSEAGVAAIYWPAAFLLAAIYCFGFAFMIERSKGKRGSAKP